MHITRDTPLPWCDVRGVEPHHHTDDELLIRRAWLISTAPLRKLRGIPMEEDLHVEAEIAQRPHLAHRAAVALPLADHILSLAAKYPPITNDLKKEYLGFQLRAKRDFGSSGYYIPELKQAGLDPYIKRGIVVCSGIVNVMPGAIWFYNETAAFRAIDCLLECCDDHAALLAGKCVKIDSDRFWDLLRAGREVTA